MKALALALALLATPLSALTVVIDPGHGGQDPGAIKGGLREADITLAVAESLAAKLRQAGVEVVLTRNAAATLHLIDRLELSRNFGADLFISIHADSLLIGTADGLSFYTHARQASGPEAQSLARQDILAELLFGPLAGQPESDIAGTLMDLAQTKTHDLSERLARTLATQAALKGLILYRRPLQSADFVVLRSPAVPSVLIELGFLDSVEDRARLVDPEWRAKFAEAARDAVLKWASANGVD